MNRLIQRMVPVIWTLFFTCAFADTYVRQPTIDVLHYDIAVKVKDGSDSIEAIAKIKVRIQREPASGMWLDFEDMSVDRLTVGGADRPFTLRHGRLEFGFGRSYSPDETVVIQVQYHGKPLAGLLFGNNKYGEWVVFADNWPDRAHHWFPSVDHPSDKASVSFEIAAPDKYDVIASGSLKKTTQPEKGYRIFEWSEPKTIPTYCMVFGIARFSISRSAAGKVPLSWYLFPQDAEWGHRSFGQTDSILEYFESLIAPYPYEKLAQVESTIQLGGMENAGTIFYAQSLFQETPAPQEIVVHEIAHQWFGNSVTESDWDHLWLSEGFATYFEALFVEHTNGPGALREKMARHAQKIAGYAPALTAPIVDPAQTDPAQKLTPINYEKGAWVLHMLRGILGDETFFRGMRSFYRRHEGGNASSADFQQAMESASGMDLSNFFRQWLYQPGWPDYRITWHWDASAGELELSADQGSALFDMPAEFLVSVGDRSETHKFRICNENQVFRIPLQSKPSSVAFDPNHNILKTATTTSR